MRAIIAVPVTLAMVYRAWSHKSLTPAGLVAAFITAVVHAIHPWSLPYALLIVFFLAGTKVTKVKHDVKAQLTVNASGKAGGEGPRTHIQVLANSAVASVLILLHAYQLRQRDAKSIGSTGMCFDQPGDLLVIGIIANYACVAADTFSSELGILSKSRPRLITSIKLRKVPPGTNGGVTVWGLVAGLIGSSIVVTAVMILLPFCPTTSGVSGLRYAQGWTSWDKLQFAAALILYGGLGSVLDSLLGGWLQRSVIDTRTGRIVEGDGGKNVLASEDDANVHLNKNRGMDTKLLQSQGKDNVELSSARNSNIRKRGSHESQEVPPSQDRPSRIVESGALGVLDNNDVNFLMALMMSCGAMFLAARAWDVPLMSIFGA